MGNTFYPMQLQTNYDYTNMNNKKSHQQCFKLFGMLCLTVL